MMKLKNTYSGLPRSVYIIFITRVVSAMGNFVFPFMTLLLTGKIGMGEQKVGLFLFIASMLQIPGSLLGGKLSDHMGRKKIMVTFMSLAALCLLPCVFLIDNPLTIKYIPWFLILSTFFNSISGPASGAMMNDLTEPENRQAAFSLLYMGMNIGAAIGSIVAGYLFNNYIKLLFIGNVVSNALSIILLLRYLTETKPSDIELEETASDRTDEKAVAGGLLTALLQRPSLLIFAALDTIYSFVYDQTRFSMPLFLKHVFGENSGAKVYGTLNMINCIEVILFTTIITMLTRKIRAVYNVSIAGIFFAVGFGMLYFTRSIPMFVISTIIWTVGEIINATNIGVYIANHTPITHRGRFNSIISIISGTGGAISPYIMGGYIASKGVNNVWPVIFCLAVIASFSMFLLGGFEKSRNKIA